LDDHEKFYTRSNVAFGDILISMIGANRGMAAIVDDRRIFSIKNVGLIKANNNINKYFLLYFLKSNRAKNYIELESKGGAQPFIGLGKLREFPIIIAPKNKQDSIVIELDQLYLETKQLETIYRQKIAALNELKQSILQKTFTGQLTK
jgi:type I restriction enzyme S subunit